MKLEGMIPERRIRLELLPLLDAFFLLLAFFVSSMLSMEIVRGLPVELPRAGGSTSLPKEDRLLVTVAGEGRVQLEDRTVTLEALTRELKAHPRRGSLVVGIRADRQTPYAWFVRVLGAVREADVGRVTLLTGDARDDTMP